MLVFPPPVFAASSPMGGKGQSQPEGRDAGNVEVYIWPQAPSYLIPSLSPHRGAPELNMRQRSLREAAGHTTLQLNPIHKPTLL